MSPYSLSFDFKDILRSPRIALSGKKIWVFLVANLVGFISYWMFSYLAIYFSGLSFNNAITKYGLYPFFIQSEINSFGWIFYIIGILIWTISLFLASTAINRITLKQLKGNEFFSANEAWSYAFKYWRAVIFTPIAILIIISLFIFFAAIFGLLGKIPFFGVYLVTIPYIIYFIGSLFTIYTGFVFITSLTSSPSIVAVYEEDTMGTVFQSYSITWSQPWRLIIYNILLIPIIFISVQLLSWFWLNSIGFIEYIFGNDLIMGNNFLSLSSYATSLVFPNWIIDISVSINDYIYSWINFRFEIPLLFSVSNNVILNSASPSQSFPAIILSFSYFLIGLSILSYGLAVFSVGQVMMFIIFKKKSDDDNVLDRKDEDEIEGELDNEQDNNILINHSVTTSEKKEEKNK